MAGKFGLDSANTSPDAFQSLWETQKRGIGNRMLLELWKNDGALTIGDLNKKLDASADEVVDSIMKARDFRLVALEPNASGETDVKLTDVGKRAIIFE